MSHWEMETTTACVTCSIHLPVGSAFKQLVGGNPVPQTAKHFLTDKYCMVIWHVCITHLSGFAGSDRPHRRSVACGLLTQWHHASICLQGCCSNHISGAAAGAARQQAVGADWAHRIHRLPSLEPRRHHASNMWQRHGPAALEQQHRGVLTADVAPLQRSLLCCMAPRQ